jgi:hypothetical protein
MLRKIYLSNKFKGIDIQEMEKTASEMGNSVESQMNNYIKK